MAGLWMAMLLAFLLTAEHSLAAVDQNWLTSVVEAIKNDYGDSISLAVNIPQNQDPDNLNQVLQDDPANSVKQMVSQGQVYKGSRVVAAGDLSHVLQNIQPFIKSSQGNVLIMYSPKADESGITAKISDVTQNRGDFVFVFSNVTSGSDTFKRLEISSLGLGNIFRCYEPGEDSFQCTSCSSDGGVAPSCVANTAVSSQEEGGGTEISAGGMDTELIPGGLGGEELPTGQGKAGRVRKCKGRRKGQCRRRGGGKRKKGGRVRKGKRRNKGLKGGRRRKGGEGRRNKSVTWGWSKRRGKGRRNKSVTWGWSKRRGKGRRRRKSKGKRWGLENDLVLVSL